MFRPTLLVTMVLAGLSVGGCKKDETKVEKKTEPAAGKDKPAPAAKGCGIATQVVADWLTTTALGPLVDDAGSPAAKLWAEQQDLQESYVAVSGFEAWCAAQPRRLDEGCFQASSAERADCKDALAAIGGLRVEDPACMVEIKTSGAEWLALADGARRAVGGTPEAKAFDDKVDGYAARIPEDRKPFCADGGIPLECFAQQLSAPCKALVDQLRAALAPAAAPPSAPDKASP